ncbi:196_t:CDS:10 [Entrophospora sp. SA101]|nr:196_t:CDS:10 [Entrophospora sp. SA101]
MLQQIFLSIPDMFVFPSCWNTYKDLLINILLEDAKSGTCNPVFAKKLRCQIEKFIEVVRARNEVLNEKKGNTFERKNLKEIKLSRIINILDKIGPKTDYDVVTSEYFCIKNKFPLLEEEITTSICSLCFWAVTNLRSGDYRIYSVCRILDIWKKIAYNDNEKIEKQTCIQNSLMKFLNEYQIGKNGLDELDEYEVISRLFGELIRYELFSHHKYMLRLIANGYIHSDSVDYKNITHLKYLTWFPLLNDDYNQLNQRRIILYGVRGEDIQDKKDFEMLASKIKEKLSTMFSEKAKELDTPGIDDPFKDYFDFSLNFDDETINLFKSVTKFTQVRLTRFWLWPAIKQFVQNAPIDMHNWKTSTQPGSSLLNARQFATIIQVFDLTKDYYTLFEVILWVLNNTLEKNIFPLIINTIKNYELVWRAMGKYNQILDAVLEKLEQDLQLAIKPQLSIAISKQRSRLSSEIEQLMYPIPPNVQNDSRIFPSDDEYLVTMLYLCTDFIDKYSQDYDHVELRRILEIFGDLLREIGDRTISGFDDAFKKWTDVHCSDDDNLLKQDKGTWFLIFFVVLVSRNLVKIETIITYLCNTNLARLVNKLFSSKPLDSRELINCKNLIILTRLLLLIKDQNNRFAIIEYSLDPENDCSIKDQLRCLRRDFSKVFWFKHLCTVNPESVYERFVMGSKKIKSAKELGKRLIEVLKMALQDETNTISDPFEYVQKIFSKANLWNLSKTRVEFLLYVNHIQLMEASTCRLPPPIFNESDTEHSIFLNDSGGSINSYGDKTADQNNEMALKILKGHIVKYFWEEIVLKSKLDCNDCNSLSFIVKGIRNNIASELMEYGNIILKKCKQLVPDIEELFRSLLLSIDDDEKMKFCDSLLTQVTAIKNEKNDEDFLACLMPRIKLFVLVIHILTARVAATSTQEACQKMKEYKLIEKWTILLLSLLCDDRVHRNGGGAKNFESILDVVSFLLDEMGKNARLLIVAELRASFIRTHIHTFQIPITWGDRIKRVLPLPATQKTVGSGKRKFTISDCRNLYERVDDDSGINNSYIDLKIYGAKIYKRPRIRFEKEEELGNDDLVKFKNPRFTLPERPFLAQSPPFVVKLVVRGNNANDTSYIPMKIQIIATNKKMTIIPEQKETKKDSNRR